jgi:hypothetical protein
MPGACDLHNFTSCKRVTLFSTSVLIKNKTHIRKWCIRLAFVSRGKRNSPRLFQHTEKYGSSPIKLVKKAL